MALVKLMAGTVVDIPTRDEMGGYVDNALTGARAAWQEQDRERERVRGVKHMYLPILQGIPSGGAITLGDKQSGPPLGPEQGYAWSLTRLVVDGLTSGTTPDVVNLYRNAVTGQPPVWQFNGNNLGYTWGIGQMIVKSGEALRLASVGSFAATGLIRLSGEFFELPAEMLAKLVVVS